MDVSAASSATQPHNASESVVPLNTTDVQGNALLVGVVLFAMLCMLVGVMATVYAITRNIRNRRRPREQSARLIDKAAQGTAAGTPTFP